MYDNGVVFDYDAPLPEFHKYQGYYEHEPSNEWDAHLDDYDDLGEC